MSSSTTKYVIAGVAGAGLAAAVVIAVYEGKATVREPSAAPRVVEGGEQVALAGPAPARPTFTPVARAVKDRAQRDALAAAIANARAARVAGGTTSGGGTGGAAGASPRPGPGGGAAGSGKVDLTPGELSKEEIRDGVREVVPMLADCYTLMLDKHPNIGGKVTAKLVVDAEPDIGTIVTMEDDTEIAMTGAAATPDDRELQSDLADFRQCLGATLESVALPPLGDKDGGRVMITYPFRFAPSEDDERSQEPPPAPAPGPSQRKATAPKPDRSADTPASLLKEAEDAAKRSQWGTAMRRAEGAIHHVDAQTPERARAAMVASLAACNLRNATKAKAYYPLLTPSSRTLVVQRCLSNGIDLSRVADQVKDPFRGAPAAPSAPPPGDDSTLKDPFR